MSQVRFVTQASGLLTTSQQHESGPTIDSEYNDSVSLKIRR
jgi:hypothetical protein